MTKRSMIGVAPAMLANACHDLGTGDAGPEEISAPVHYSWSNPVAIVTLRRVFGTD